MMGAWPAFARGFVSRAVRASWLATIGEVWVIRWSYFTVPGVDSAPVGFRWQCCTSLRVTVHGINPLSVLHLVGGGDPGGEARPGFIAEQLRGGESARGLIFAQLIVEESVVEAGAGGVGGAGAVVEAVNPRPVGGGQAHGAGLATGVELATGQREGSQSLAGRADGVHFSVGRGIMRGGDGVHALAHDAALAHDDGAERAARAVEHILGGQRDGAAQKLGICR